eukprot:6215519-Pyramimonas_sp.AAC.1
MQCFVRVQMWPTGARLARARWSFNPVAHASLNPSICSAPRDSRYQAWKARASAAPSWMRQGARVLLARGNVVDFSDQPLFSEFVQQASAKWTAPRRASLALPLSDFGEAAMLGRLWGLDASTVER